MKRNRTDSQAPIGTSGLRRGWAGSAGKDALDLASAALGRAGFRDGTLVLRWSEIAGADIAQLARPVKLTDGPEGAVLTLKCEAGSAVFLQHQTRELLERLASYLGAGRIARLRFVSGELERPSEPPDHPVLRVPGPGEMAGPQTLPEALARLERRRLTQRRRRAD